MTLLEIDLPNKVYWTDSGRIVTASAVQHIFCSTTN